MDRKGIARRAAAGIEAGGFSISPVTGMPPAGGYMVARAGHTRMLPAGILGDEDALARALDAIIMGDSGYDGAYIGGWVHDGMLWIEPADNISDRQAAIAAGRARDQIAVWDVAGEQEIMTGGTGGIIQENDHRAGAGGIPAAAAA
jgi:hypothetical protein